MALHLITETGNCIANVAECDGCGDTALWSETDGAWAQVRVHGEIYVLCSCDCFYAWNHHVPWPGLFGERPGDPSSPESLF